MPAPIKGQYLVYVNYFGGGYRSDEEGQEEAVQALTTAQVTVITEEGRRARRSRRFWCRCGRWGVDAGEGVQLSVRLKYILRRV